MSGGDAPIGSATRRSDTVEKEAANRRGKDRRIAIAPTSRERGRGDAVRRGGEEREDTGHGGTAVEAADESVRVGEGKGPRRVSRGLSRKSEKVDVGHPDRRDAGDALGVGGGADGRVAARDGLGGDLSRDGGTGDESGHGGEGGGAARGGEVRCGVRDVKRA